MVPTGIAVGLQGAYMAGRRLGVDDITEWFVKAYTPSGETKWLDDFNHGERE